MSAALSPFVTVLSHRMVKSWPKETPLDQCEPVTVLPLGEALTCAYRTDAHCVQYLAVNHRRNCGAILDRGLEVRIETIFFDFDCDEVHGTSMSAPESWRQKFRESVEQLAGVHPAPFMYETRGGARIVYGLPSPLVLRTSHDAVEYKRAYAVALAYLRRRFSLVGDPACADWTRLFRLPRSTRDAAPESENWPTSGDPFDVGTLCIEASDDDVRCAAKESKAFVAAKQVLDFRPNVAVDGYGLLFHLLRARGDVLRQHGASAYVIRCPRERHHTSGQTGNGSTLLYLPARGQEVGAIECKHAHCSHYTVRAWLEEFSFAERDAARRNAGIARAAG